MAAERPSPLTHDLFVMVFKGEIKDARERPTELCWYRANILRAALECAGVNRDETTIYEIQPIEGMGFAQDLSPSHNPKIEWKRHVVLVYSGLAIEPLTGEMTPWETYLDSFFADRTRRDLEVKVAREPKRA